jgi:hypothetical protein
MITTDKKSLRKDQLRDPACRDLLYYLTDENLPKNDKLAKNIVMLSQYFEVEDGILYYI